MHGKVVLVCTDRARTWRQVTPPLAGAGNQLVHAESAAQAASLIDAGAVDLAVVEWPSGVAVDQLVEASDGRVPLVVLVGESGVNALAELVGRHGLLNLCVARPEQESGDTRVVDPAELVVTCEKILRRDIFGLTKYLIGPAGAELPSRIVKHAAERDGLIDELTQAVRALGAGRRIAESVGLVGDELCTNAVYNAPRLPDGSPRYGHVDRREKIALEPDEYVRVQFGSDGRTFGLSVSDRFGALAAASLRLRIARCVSSKDPIERKAGGAGIGLYASLCHADQLVFNIEPGRQTEVIALWSLARRTGGRGVGTTSLHVFERLPGRPDSAGENTSTPGPAGRWFTPTEPASGAGHDTATQPEERDEIILQPFEDDGEEAALAITAPRAAAPVGGRPGEDAVPIAIQDSLLADTEAVPEATPEAIFDRMPEASIELGDLDLGGRGLGAGDAPAARPARRPPVDRSGSLRRRGRAAPRKRSTDRAIAVPSANGSDRIERTGPNDAPNPSWVGPLTCLRGVQIARRADGPDLDALLARLRSASSLTEAIEGLLDHLVARWTAAMLLCRMGDALVPWTAAGDVDTWEELCDLQVPLTPGWLRARTLSPGVTLAALADDAGASLLGDSLTAQRVDEGVAISFVLDQAVLVVFACRWRGRPGQASADEIAGCEEIQRELSELTARIDHLARRPAAARRPSARARSAR